MNRQSQLDALLKEALSPHREAPPQAPALERASAILQRGRAIEDRRIVRRMSLAGALLSLCELAALALWLFASPPSTPLGLLIAIVAAIQAFTLFAGSLGTRAAVRQLQPQ